MRSCNTNAYEYTRIPWMRRMIYSEACTCTLCRYVCFVMEYLLRQRLHQLPWRFGRFAYWWTCYVIQTFLLTNAIHWTSNWTGQSLTEHNVAAATGATNNFRWRFRSDACHIERCLHLLRYTTFKCDLLTLMC